VKSVSIRMPEEILDFLRRKAAEETIRENRMVSINALTVSILREAMEADEKRKGGK
jgi:hypothetical protein